MTSPHTFHIPVMGIGYTIDTPLKVAHYGITSVVSIGDDILLEKLRKFHSEKRNKEYIPIDISDDDHRAKRIKAYLNLLKELVDENFTALKSTDFTETSEITKYFRLLPENSPLKAKYNLMLNETDEIKKLSSQSELREALVCGDIDVNIMTKTDKPNLSSKKEPLPQEYNDAHAALRGFATSDLNASLVLSAGLNPRLYSYAENFPDFFPNEKGEFKKKITLKVSDYRSALIQGKFLAKKGIWISEYRIESGLNCGGHAFATQGYLLGPILEEFKNLKQELIDSTFELCNQAYKAKGIEVDKTHFDCKVSVQGGVGTSSEHQALFNHYDVDSVGWGTPFLLVPEAVNVDSKTLELLCKAEEKDLYMSHTSPLGVLFNTLRGNTKDLIKQQNIAKNRPGSACPKKFLSFNTEFTKEPVCTASRQYQDLKIKHLKSLSYSPEKLELEIEKVTDKSCICVGLGTSALIVNDIEHKVEGEGVSICPGPNLAYFSKVSTLQEMVDHIYGRINLLSKKYRPHMFVKELQLYVEYLSNEMKSNLFEIGDKQFLYFKAFIDNLLDGIAYYKKLFTNWSEENAATLNTICKELESNQKLLLNMQVKFSNQTA